MYKLANDIKLAFYGNRIVMFAPLYLSNYCVNGCVYCPYHLKNKHIARIKLTQEQVRQRSNSLCRIWGINALRSKQAKILFTTR